MTEIKKLGHLMLDLETLGNKSNSAILSIGAVEFDLETGETGREFYQRIDLQSCIDKGLIINGSTFYWWITQNEKARQEVAKGGENLIDVLLSFKQFTLALGDFQIWGNGVRFDVGILEDAYVACGIQEMPWNFRNERDVRTLVSFAPNIKEHFPLSSALTIHLPIDDCKYQIAYCHAIWEKLRYK